jgi:hypothetical protein
VLKTYLDRYPEGAFAAAATALIEQQDQRLKAELAAREEQRKRAEEARKAADLRRKEEERKAREAKLAEERRRAEEMRNAAEASRLEQQQRTESLAHAEELRKAYKEVELAKEAAKAAEEQRIAAVKAAEEARRAANLALANPANLKTGVRPPIHSDLQAGGLFAEPDAKRIRAHAEQHQLNLPDFRFQVPGEDVPPGTKQFMGAAD